MVEKELIVAAQGGDTKAFDALVIECLPKLKGLLIKHYHIQESDFDDIVQVAANKAWLKIQNFRGDSAFLTWFYTIIRNETLNFVRRRKQIDKREVVAHFDNNEDGETQDYDFVSKQALDERLAEDAQSIIERRETLDTYKEIIVDVLGKLTPTHREIIKMVMQDELSYKEISEKLDIPIGTVMSRLFFARRHAQKLIKEYARKNDVPIECLTKI